MHFLAKVSVCGVFVASHMTQKSISVGQSSALSAFLTDFMNERMLVQLDKI